MRKSFNSFCTVKIEENNNKSLELLQKSTQYYEKRQQMKNTDSLHKILQNWHIYSDTRHTEKLIINRFRQFHKRLIKTRCFLTWVENSSIRQNPHSLTFSNSNSF